MPGAAGSADLVECPECGKTLSAKANYCTGCGHQMRT
jgi:predicted amidophosphoribosyltransferase